MPTDRLPGVAMSYRPVRAQASPSVSGELLGCYRPWLPPTYNQRMHQSAMNRILFCLEAGREVVLLLFERERQHFRY